MPVEALLLMMDEVEVSFGIPDAIAHDGWQHDRTLRKKARTIAERILRAHGARAGEGWSIELGLNGKATVNRLW